MILIEKNKNRYMCGKGHHFRLALTNEKVLIRLDKDGNDTNKQYKIGKI
jgi:hypothetical protein